MIRLICGGIIAISVAYIGLGIKKYYLSREKYFEKIIDLIEVLSANVTYLKKPIPTVISEFVANGKGELIRELVEYNTYLSNADYAKIASIKTPLLKAAERQSVIEMLTAIGRADSKTELDMLSGYKAKFKIMHEASIKQRSTTGALAFKLSVLLGVVILILLA